MTEQDNKSIEHEQNQAAEQVSASVQSEKPVVVVSQTGNPKPVTSAINSIDTGKLLELLKNPLHSLKLDPAKEWVLSAISAAAGVIGFFFWVWAMQKKAYAGINGNLDGLGNFSELFGAIGRMAYVTTTPFSSLFNFARSGTYFVLAICSIALLVAAFTLIGNWMGTQKRSWMESITFYGGTQLMLGAGLILCGIIAFISIELSALIGVIMLVLWLILLVDLALGLHSVGNDKRYPFVLFSVGGYMVALYIIYRILT